MKSFTKNILTSIITVLIACSSILPAVKVHAENATTLEVNYDNHSRIFVVEGHTKKAAEALTVRICRYNGLDVYTNEPDKNQNGQTDVGEPILFKTVLSGKDKSFSIKVKLELSETITQGRYRYDVGNSKGWITSGNIILTSSEGISAETLLAINGNKTEIEKVISEGSEIFNIMDDGSEKNFSYIAETIENMKGYGEYSLSEFLDAYLVAEGFYYFSSGNIDFASLLSKYGDVIGDDAVKAYHALPDKYAKECVQTLFRENVIKHSIDAEFKEHIFAATYFTEDDITQFKELLLKYAIASGSSSVAAFDKLNSTNKENVVTALFNKRENLITADAILINFKEYVNSALEKQEKSENGDKGGTGSSGGGGSSGEAKRYESVVGVEDNLREEIPVTKESTFEFTDTKSHWAKETIGKMVEFGYLKGFDDGSFRPDTSITRAEFVAIICRILNLEEKNTYAFKDVKETDWFATYIATAQEAGLITGSDGKFSPNANITRQDAAVIVKRILDANSIKTELSNVIYDDDNEISGYAREAIITLSNFKLLNGYNGCVNPKENLTRAEAAMLLYRTSEILK